MSWMLPLLFIHLLTHVRGATGLASLMPAPPWTVLVVSLMLLALGVMINYHSPLLLWPRFQKRPVQ